eukprot:sb/3475504/
MIALNSNTINDYTASLPGVLDRVSELAVTSLLRVAAGSLLPDDTPPSSREGDIGSIFRVPLVTLPSPDLIRGLLLAASTGPDREDSLLLLKRCRSRSASGFLEAGQGRVLILLLCRSGDGVGCDND